MGLTIEQKRAVEIRDCSSLVSAGAGSGKTKVLSEKVKYLVSQEGDKRIHVDEMLILTFTDLAAGEMRNRIQNKLKKDFKEEAEKAETAFITTFDSYAFSLVKKYHLLLGLDEKVSIITKEIMDVKRREWVDQEFDRLYENNDSEFYSLLDRTTTKDDSDVKELIIELVNEGLKSSNPELYFEPISNEVYLANFEEMIKIVEKDLEALKDDLIDALSKIEDEEIKEKVNNVVNSLISAKLLDQYLDAKAEGKKMISKSSVPEEEMEAFLNVVDKRKALTDYLKEMKGYFKYKNEYLDSKKYKDYLKSLAKKIYLKDREFKNKNQVFEFGDIAYFAYILVRDNLSIRKEISDSFKIIMVDEYQDTSFSQERFLKLISKDNIFMVGDIKQSIYRFRNARPDIFKDKYDNFPSSNKIDLNKNFRSRKEVLNDINYIFSKIMTNEYGDADYLNEHVIIPGNINYDLIDIEKPHTEEIVYDDASIADKFEYEAKIIAEDILKKINKPTYIMNMDKNDNPVKELATFSSFCILMDRGAAFPTYKRVFEEYGIPLYIENNEKILNNFLVQITRNVFTCLYKIENENYDDEFIHSFTSILRSFLYAYSDDEIYKIIKEKKYYKTQAFSDLKKAKENTKTASLKELLTNYYDIVDVYYKLIDVGSYDKNKEYIVLFLETFAQMDNLNYSFEDAISYLNHLEEYKLDLTLPSSSSSKNAVKLMNIHKSKGLEFPIVYFASLFSEFNTEEIKKNMMISEKYDICMKFFDGSHAIDSFIFKKEEKRNMISELIRLFYVSLTRAKEQMIFVHPNGKLKKHISNCESFLEFYLYAGLDCDKKDAEILNYKNQASVSSIKKSISVDTNELPKFKRKEKHRSSKLLSLDSSSSSLNFGNDIHYLFRVADFSTCDLEGFKSKDKEILKRFYSSTLFEKIKNGKIFKEFEFEDEDVKGIIDLFVVLENEIVLIDYKLKNLDDEEYVNQLKNYAYYLSKTFKKPVKSYLYACLTGEIKTIISGFEE